MTFAEALQTQLESTPKLNRRGQRILKILKARPSKLRDWRIKRMENFVRADNDIHNEIIDWGKIDWTPIIERVISLLLKLIEHIAGSSTGSKIRQI